MKLAPLGAGILCGIVANCMFCPGNFAAAEPIPELAPKGEVYKTEGPTDFRMYPKAEGTVRAVMVFVDFPDAPAGDEKTESVAAHLLGDSQAKQFFKDQSYGKMTLDVTVTSGWQRMPRRVAEYGFKRGIGFAEHKAYIADACALFQTVGRSAGSPGDPAGRPTVDFSAYQIVYIAAAKTGEIPLSPAFNAHPGSGVKAAHGEVRLAVTFGNDSYRNRYTNLIHETGHLLGLPDLYSYTAGIRAVGPWDIMSDIFKGTSFLGWHRHKLGWLDAGRKVYVAGGTKEVTLTPLSSDAGVSMVVIPLDDAQHPSKVLVAEVAEPVLGSNGKLWGDGVLIYSVDASVATGKDPVVVFPNKPGDSKEYGRLFQAPFGAGDSFSNPDIPVTIEVMRKQGNGFSIVVKQGGSNRIEK